MSELTANPELDEFLKEVLSDQPDETEAPTGRPIHINHPTDPATTWCGVQKSRPGYRNHEAGKRKTSCPDCLDIRSRFAHGWWWDTHRRFFQSECHIHDRHTFHNCSAHIA